MTSRRRGRKGLVGSLAAIGLLGAAAVVWSSIYVPDPEGSWIRDTSKYADSVDQINVLGDIAPGASQVMLQVGIRLNALAAAGKKQNWDLADYERQEIEEAFDRLSLTRPGMEPDLDTFITGSLAPIGTAITAKDKTALATALSNATTACTTCHQLYGDDFLVVKIGKSALPLQ
ncbi:MAG TPA: hypothetical protein VGK20_09075 [Candidatus Binatia bacterium]|jgi:hypothetical protein